MVSDQISQDANSNEGNNKSLEEWHAPASFSLLQSNGVPSLDSDDSSLAEQVPKVLGTKCHFSEIKKKLHEL